jgi:hypothetical protein
LCRRPQTRRDTAYDTVRFFRSDLGRTARHRTAPQHVHVLSRGAETPAMCKSSSHRHALRVKHTFFLVAGRARAHTRRGSRRVWAPSLFRCTQFGFAAQRHTPLLFEGTPVQRGAICIHNSHASSSLRFFLSRAKRAAFDSQFGAINLGLVFAYPPYSASPRGSVASETTGWDSPACGSFSRAVRPVPLSWAPACASGRLPQCCRCG